MTWKCLNWQNLFLLVAGSIFKDFSNILILVIIVTGGKVFWNSGLQVLLLLCFIEVLENPILLDFLVGREFFLEEDEGMHLHKKIQTPLTVFGFPKVFTFEFKLGFLLIIRLWIIICFKTLNVFGNKLVLPFVCRVFCPVLDFLLKSFESVPVIINWWFLILPLLLDWIKVEFHLLAVSIPVK